MKLAARVTGDDNLRALARLEETLARAALDAAADALVRAAERAREDAGVAGTIARDPAAVPAPPSRVSGEGPARALFADTRELGALERPPAPWLAPVLPAARGPMRAAARAAVARALSLRRKRKR